MIKKILSIALGILGVVMIVGNQSTWMVIIATFVWIAAATLWILSDPKRYNEACDQTKLVGGAENITVQELYERFKAYDTALGRPWLGKIRGIKSEAMIFGVNQNDEYIYAYKKGDNLILAYNDIPSFIKMPEGKEIPVTHHINKANYKENLAYKLDTGVLLEELAEAFENYVRKGIVPEEKHTGEAGKIYHFSEEFKWTGQRFALKDVNEHIIYEVEGTMPLKSFYIYKEDKEIFKMTKKIVHVLPHYDFYWDNKFYGSFEKKIHLSRDVFKMETAEGMLEMRSVAATIGSNYRVKLEGRLIGTIAEKFNLEIENLVYDNYVISVQEDKYLPLITALAVMAARELARDREADTE